MRNSSSLDWLRFMHTPNDYRVSLFFPILAIMDTVYSFSCDCSNSSLPWQAEKYMIVNSDTYSDLFILLFYNSEGQNISLSVKIKMRTS